MRDPRRYTPTAPMLRELLHAAEGFTAADSMARERCRRRGLVDWADRVTGAGAAVLRREVSKLNMTGGVHA